MKKMVVVLKKGVTKEKVLMMGCCHAGTTNVKL